MNSLKINFTSVLITALILFVISIIDYTAPAQSQDDSEEITTEVAVHTGSIIRTTLHGYVKVYGTVAPQKAEKDAPSAHSRISTLIAGVIENVSCVEGQLVKKGTLLFHLDSRLADAQISKASETYQFAQRNLQRQKKRVQAEMASLENMREKSEEGLEFAQQNFDRQKKLFAENGTSQKNYQEAKHLLASTQNELLDIQNQQNLLDLSPE
ncbi:HlyD family secretion protein, partial [bacterium]|nr:HlyD family secretion protein [bacterium]